MAAGPAAHRQIAAGEGTISPIGVSRSPSPALRRESLWVAWRVQTLTTQGAMSLAVDRLPFMRCTGAALALFPAVLLPGAARGAVHAHLRPRCSSSRTRRAPRGRSTERRSASSRPASATASSALPERRRGVASSHDRDVRLLDAGHHERAQPDGLRYDDLRYAAADVAGEPDRGPRRRPELHPDAGRLGGRPARRVLGDRARGTDWHTLVGRPAGDGFGCGATSASPARPGR